MIYDRAFKPFVIDLGGAVSKKSDGALKSIAKEASKAASTRLHRLGRPGCSAASLSPYGADNRVDSNPRTGDCAARGPTRRTWTTRSGRA